MKVYGILVHPKRQSLNGAMFDTAIDFFQKKKYTVETLDLFRSDFDPWAIHDQITADIQTKNYSHKWFAADTRDLLPEFSQLEIEKLKSSDLLYLQTPIWWWGLPAIMKAYIENVFIYNVLFSLDNEHTRENKDSTVFKFLRNKKMLLSITTGSSEKFMVEHFNTVDNMLAPIKARFEFLGYDLLPTYHGGALSGETDATDQIKKFQEYLEKIKL
jgi:NAD(P)H dehydrogenase (quinone)